MKSTILWFWKRTNREPTQNIEEPFKGQVSLHEVEFSSFAHRLAHYVFVFERS